jgi:hypothetical protein
MSGIPASPHPNIDLKVRAHHAGLLSDYLTGVYGSIDDLNNTYQQNAKDRSEPEGGLPGYYHDTYGPTAANVKRMHESFGSLVTDFMELSDDATVLATTSRDQICDSCFIGNHCDGKSSLRGDNGYLRAITGTAAKLGLSEMVTPVEETVELRDGTTRPGSALLMPAITARSVFAEPTFHIRTRRGLFRAELLAEHAITNWLTRKR